MQDIDYRMAQSTLNATQTVPTATQQGIISGDIDLRHGLTTSGQSQSWRPTPSTSVMESTQCDDDMLRPSGGQFFAFKANRSQFNF